MDTGTLYHLIFTLTLLGVLALSGYFGYTVRTRRFSTVHKSSAPLRPSPAPLPPVQMAMGVAVEPLPNPYPPYSGTLRINDPLRDNSMGYSWMDDSVKPTRENEGCRFCQDVYHILENRAISIGYCLALQTNFSNFVYQIDALLLAGTEIGVVFRQNSGFRFYYFYLRPEGTFGLRCNMGMQSRQLTEGYSPAIHAGYNCANTFAVVADGATITLYANQQLLATVTDYTYQAGRIGTAITVSDSPPGDAVFRHVMLWTL